MENEIILRSKKYPELFIQIFNGNEFGMLGEGESNDNVFFTDNEDYAYEILKLLKEAERRGCFDKIKDVGEKENIAEILI